MLNHTVADFGLSRFLPSDGRPLTPGSEVVTMWYRAPELLLESKTYTISIDMWSAGLVICELVTGGPVLTGNTVDRMLTQIETLIGEPELHEVNALEASGCRDIDLLKQHLASNKHFGSPRGENLWSKLGDLVETPEVITHYVVSQFLSWDPKRRPTAEQALAVRAHATSATRKSIYRRWWDGEPAPVPKESIPITREQWEKTRARGDEPDFSDEGESQETGLEEGGVPATEGAVSANDETHGAESKTAEKTATPPVETTVEARDPKRRVDVPESEGLQTPNWGGIDAAEERIAEMTDDKTEDEPKGAEEMAKVQKQDTIEEPRALRKSARVRWAATKVVEDGDVDGARERTDDHKPTKKRKRNG